MTETPNPNPNPLEAKLAETKQPKKTQPVKVETPTTLTDILGGLAKGLLPLAFGTAGGYWATGGPGGIGASLLLTSVGAALITETEKDTNSQKIADLCYKLGMVVGAV